jgi:peptide/nickel transport system permease protein
MLSFITRRAFQTLIVLFLITIITFVISRVIPGDPARAALGPQATQAMVDVLRQEMDLNKPLLQQYLAYLSGLLRGDLGISILTRRPVATDLGKFLPASIELALFSVIIWLPLGLLIGIYCAVRVGKLSDALTRLATILGVSMPVFVTALIMQLVFYKVLDVLPAAGRLGFTTPMPKGATGLYLLDSLLTGDSRTFLDALRHIILPALTMSLASCAVVVRMTRGSLLEVLSADYIRTARAKGLRERVVLIKHALKNALISVITVVGLLVAQLIAWMFLVEYVFAWPGIGRYAVRAITNLDFMPIMGATLVITCVYVVINFLVDVTYAFIDPRIRLY